MTAAQAVKMGPLPTSDRGRARFVVAVANVHGRRCGRCVWGEVEVVAGTGDAEMMPRRRRHDGGVRIGIAGCQCIVAARGIRPSSKAMRELVRSGQAPTSDVAQTTTQSLGVFGGDRITGVSRL